MEEELTNKYRTSYYPNRTLCDALADMRKCYETYNFSPMLALIEEVQVLGNRMEAALADKRDIEQMSEQRSLLKAEIRELVAQAKALQPAKATEIDDAKYG